MVRRRIKMETKRPSHIIIYDKLMLIYDNNTKKVNERYKRILVKLAIKERVDSIEESEYLNLIN